MAHTIVIDAGHGSNTAGKRTPALPGYPDGYKEHWINVKCAYYASLAAQRCGIKVVKCAWDDLNSKDDSDVPIITRQNLVRKSGADVCISFHANASNSSNKFDSAAGAATYIHSVAAKRRDSAKLAKHIQTYLPKGTTQRDRGVNYGNLGMCNAVYMSVKAAALIEIAFMTNLAEAKLMTSDAFCKEQAEDVIHGVCEYLGVAYKKEVTATVKETSPSAPKKEADIKLPTFTVGKTYTLQTALKVRKGPGTTYEAKTHAELTEGGKKHDTDKNGSLDAGTKVTCKEVKVTSGYIWIRVPSGWIAAYNRSKAKAYIK